MLCSGLVFDLLTRCWSDEVGPAVKDNSVDLRERAGLEIKT